MVELDARCEIVCKNSLLPQFESITFHLLQDESMYRFKPITLIAAIDAQGGIGKRGRIPWYIPEDLVIFRDTTLGRNVMPKTNFEDPPINAVIMGRKTWKSIPKYYRGLRDRYNVVISTTLSQREVAADNVTGAPVQLSRSIEEAMRFCHRNSRISNIFIGGGAEIYQSMLERGFVDYTHITHIPGDCECDTRLRLSPNRILLNETYVPTSDSALKVEYAEIVHRNPHEYMYFNVLRQILPTSPRQTRNAPTYSIFGPQLVFDLKDGFPLLTTKQMFWRGIVEELLFFLRGETDSRILSDRNVRIWEPNTSRVFLDERGLHEYAEGDMGPMYGWNWRHFGATYSNSQVDYTGKGYDQLRDLLHQLKFQPNSRRMLLTTFDPSKVNQSVLAPCHGLVTQFYVNEGVLDCQMYQRSADSFLGLPFNIASYALLMQILCHITGYQPGRLLITIGDCHLYQEHIPAARQQLERSPFLPPKVSILKPFVADKGTQIDDMISYIEGLTATDFSLQDYRYHPTIVAPMVA